ncbi:MAG: CARDB domain-containing protein [Candidatus Bathyarchaeia archaeon]
MPVSPEGLPDLIVEDIIWFPKEPHVAEDISLQVMIKNVGDAPIKKAFRLELYVGKKKDPARWTFTFSAEKPLLPSEGWIGIFDIDKVMRSKYGWALSEGDHKLRAVVDPDQQVVESNEENNELVKILHVGPKLTTRATTITSPTTITKVTGTTTMAVISEVEYPRRVQPGEEFEIKVTIQYSSPYEIRIRIWDHAFDRPIDEMTDKLGPYMGLKTYTFVLKAPTEVTIWELSVDVCYLLPYYIESSRTYKFTEPGYNYDLEIYVGTAETETTTSIYSYTRSGTEARSETGLYRTSSISTASSSISTTSVIPTVRGKAMFSSYTPYLLGVAIVALSAMFIALKRRRPHISSTGIKHCLNCNAELPLDAEYCHECRARQSSTMKEV